MSFRVNFANILTANEQNGVGAINGLLPSIRDLNSSTRNQ